MKVDEKEVRKIAKLARINVSNEEVKNLEQELTSILDWIEQLNEVNTDNVEPLTSVVETTMKQRDDLVNKGGHPDVIVANAPLSEDHFFMVPKVVE